MTEEDYTAICGAMLPKDFPLVVEIGYRHVIHTILKRDAVSLRGGYRKKSLEYLYVDDDAKDAIMDLVDVSINGEHYVEDV